MFEVLKGYENTCKVLPLYKACMTTPILGYLEIRMIEVPDKRGPDNRGSTVHVYIYIQYMYHDMYNCIVCDEYYAQVVCKYMYTNTSNTCTYYMYFYNMCRTLVLYVKIK